MSSLCFEFDFFFGLRLNLLSNPANYPCEAQKLDSGCCSFTTTFAVFLIQLAEHVLPWHRCPLNLTIRSAYISGNLTLAFTLPLLFQLWTTNLKAALARFYKGMRFFSLVMLGLFSFSSRYSSMTLALSIAVCRYLFFFCPWLHAIVALALPSILKVS